MIEPHEFVDDGSGAGCDVCPLVRVHPVHVAAAPPPAREMNAVGSDTGRVMVAAPPTSVLGALTTNATGHRRIIFDAVTDAGARGVTSIEAAAMLPPTRQGGPQVSNRTASRLGELWEEGLVTIARERGSCRLGVCRRHHKPDDVHRASAPCDVHGKPLTRDGASIWVRTAS